MMRICGGVQSMGLFDKLKSNKKSVIEENEKNYHEVLQWYEKICARMYLRKKGVFF